MGRVTEQWSRLWRYAVRLPLAELVSYALALSHSHILRQILSHCCNLWQSRTSKLSVHPNGMWNLRGIPELQNTTPCLTESEPRYVGERGVSKPATDSAKSIGSLILGRK